MAYSLDQTGHLAIFIYFMVFGLSFLGSSTIYLANLNQIDKPHACVASLRTLTEPEPDLTEPCRTHMDTWKGLAVTGIIYGSFCLIAAVFQLWRACCLYSSSNVTAARSTSLRSAAEEKVSQIHQLANQQMMMRGGGGGGDVDQESFRSACVNCLNTSAFFMFVMMVWLVSFIVPAYMAVQLYRTDAIWRDGPEESAVIFPAPLILLLICIMNFAGVLLTCVAICTESEFDEDELWVTGPYQPWVTRSSPDSDQGGRERDRRHYDDAVTI